MKLKSILLSSLLVAVGALPLGVRAADTDKAAEVKAPAAEVKSEKAKKPHSHMTEKTGMEAKAPDANAPKPKGPKDMDKHYHPRDGK